ncbi:MAG: hypothetical protein JXK94_14875 [Deltaproteobacteria bacterium]|nr:hypothetical protein [Deltaproteobacteria bacterium]
MKMKTTPYYSVIKDTTDFCGMGEYLHKHKCLTYQEAKKFLEENQHCTHIDFFDGEEWHHCIPGDMSNK